MLQPTVTVSGYITEEEKKEILHKERESLLAFLNDCKELLHIEDINKLDVEKFKKDYEINHCYMCKDELTLRLDIVDNVLHYIKTYKG